VTKLDSHSWNLLLSMQYILNTDINLNPAWHIICWRTDSLYVPPSTLQHWRQSTIAERVFLGQSK